MQYRLSSRIITIITMTDLESRGTMSCCLNIIQEDVIASYALDEGEKVKMRASWHPDRIQELYIYLCALTFAL